MKSLVISSSLRESGPENWICTGFCAPLLRSSSTTYSAPTRRLQLVAQLARDLVERALALRALADVDVDAAAAGVDAAVGGLGLGHRARQLARPSPPCSCAYSRLLLDGVRTSMAIVP